MPLNDKEIRKRCLVPTHKHVDALLHRHLYSKVGDQIYSMSTGQLLAINQMDPLGLEELTEEQQAGWVQARMIEPFEPGQVKTRLTPARIVDKNADPDGCYQDVEIDGVFTEGCAREEKIISYGTSSFGYDFRLGHKFKVFSNMNGVIGDPKNFDEQCFVERELPNDGDALIIPPNSFILGYTKEKFNMPKDVIGVVLSKSTYARVGVACTCTPPEPGWSGHLTLEFANLSPLPVKMFVGEGCCQILFFQGNAPEVTYADRAGKYQNQTADPIVSRV